MVVVRGFDFFNQVFGHLFAGLIVFGKRIQELFLAEEVLIELRRQFHEVARHVCTGLRRIIAAGKHTVQAVTKLMQEGLCLVIREQSGLGFRCASKVHYVYDMRTMVFLAQFELRLEVVHPCTTTFAVPRVEVAIINGEILALVVKYFVCRHFGVIYLNILVLHEGKTIETFCQAEDTLFHRLKLKVRTKHVIRDAVFLVLEFLAVERPVPRLDFALEAKTVSIFLQLLHFCFGSRHISVTKLVKEIHHGLFSFSAGSVQRLNREIRFAEELCQLQTSVRYVDNILRIIKLAADATAIVRHVHFLTQSAVLAVLHHRKISGRFEIQQPAFFAFLFSIGFEHAFRIVVQASELCLVGDKFRPSVGGFEDVLTKGQRQHGQTRSQFAVFLFACLVEVCTVFSKRLVSILQKLALIGTEFQFVALLINGFNALEQPFVKNNRGAVFRHFRRDFHLQCLNRIVRFGMREVIETANYHRERISGVVKRLNSVLKRRRFGVIHNCIYICASLTEALFERRHIIRSVNRVERICSVRRRPVRIIQ